MKTFLALALLAAASAPSFAQDTQPQIHVFCAPGVPLCSSIVPVRLNAMPNEDCKKNTAGKPTRPNLSLLKEGDHDTLGRVWNDAGGIKQPCNA